MSHKFAIYVNNISTLAIGRNHFLRAGFSGSESLFQRGDVIEVSDKELLRRLFSVLRMRIGETFILFDKNLILDLAVKSLARADSGKVFKVVLEVIDGEVKRPTFCEKFSTTIFVPLVGRSRFESVLRTISQFSIDDFFVFQPEKKSVKAQLPERRRVEALLIAAAEQSKSYCVPNFETYSSLSNLFSDLSFGGLIVLSAEAPATIPKNFYELVVKRKTIAGRSIPSFPSEKTPIRKDKLQMYEDTGSCEKISFADRKNRKTFFDLAIVVGPEAGFSDQEEKLFRAIYDEEIPVAELSVSPSVLTVDAAVTAGLAVIYSELSRL
jgi:RsmE family RNA methyltransferase